jgi:hypothetical protein
MNGFFCYKPVVRSRVTASLGLLRSHTWIGGPRNQKQTFGQLAANGGCEPTLPFFCIAADVGIQDFNISLTAASMLGFDAISAATDCAMER